MKLYKGPFLNILPPSLVYGILRSDCIVLKYLLTNKTCTSDAKCWGGAKAECLKMSGGGENDKFEEEKFMKILVNLKDTQESIQGFSGWCIKNRKAAYKMARCWIKVIKKVLKVLSKGKDL